MQAGMSEWIEHGLLPRNVAALRLGGGQRQQGRSRSLSMASPVRNDSSAMISCSAR